MYTGAEDAPQFAFTSRLPEKPPADFGLVDFTLSTKPIREWVPWMEEKYRASVEVAEALDDDTVPMARANTGTHVFAQAFGCDVHQPDDNQPFALPLVHSPEEADKLTVPDIWSTPCLYRVFELADAVRERLGKDVWLGPCDMQTGFDIACLIWEKVEILCAMTDPEQATSVKRLAAKCGRLMRTFLKELQKEFPQMMLCGCPSVWTPPELGPWPSNDECGAVNVEMFEEFMLPELIEISRDFGSVGMHCCADADHQFPSFRNIPNFYAFNRVPPPGTGPDGFAAAVSELGGPDGPVFVNFGAQEELVRYFIDNAPRGTRAIFHASIGELDEGRTQLARNREIVGSGSGNKVP